MRMVRKKPQNGGPESGTKTDVVSRGALVKKMLQTCVLYNFEPLSEQNQSTARQRRFPATLAVVPPTSTLAAGPVI